MAVLSSPAYSFSDMQGIFPIDIYCRICYYFKDMNSGSPHPVLPHSWQDIFLGFVKGELHD